MRSFEHLRSLLDDDSPSTTPKAEEQLGLFVPLQPGLLMCNIEPAMFGCEIPLVPTHEYSTIMTYVNAHGGNFYEAYKSYYESKRRMQTFFASRAVC